ncbi:hypothetical protein CSUB01_12562 [Colletotrichum sublineola]|uniref:DNA2/NAM7 helicase-like C-terminal domain-containing protein n=1 Tax=Colletotrichum sublineola TaxID=1173701 RepID=A0A066XGV4_COLSU|nr:hypothetical protein CSUB01_12562 [Colletotrichum sublineola]
MKDRSELKKMMLDTQYRKHNEMCRFISDEFYEGKLRSGIKADETHMFPSMFPWPVVKGSHSYVEAHDGRKGIEIWHHHRMVFIDCTTQEDLGQKSKSNRGQEDLGFNLIIEMSNSNNCFIKMK